MGVTINCLDSLDSRVCTSFFRISKFGLSIPGRCCASKIIRFLCGDCHFLLSEEAHWEGWSPLPSHTHVTIASTATTLPGIKRDNAGMLEKCRDFWAMSSQPNSQNGALGEQLKGRIFFISSFLYHWRVVSHWRLIPLISLDSISSHALLSQLFFPPQSSVPFFLSPPIISFPVAQTPLNYIVFLPFTTRLFRRVVYNHYLHIIASLFPPTAPKT